MQGQGKRLSPSQLRDIVEAYVRGESSEAIGKRLGKSGVAIRKALARQGVARRDASTSHRAFALHLGVFASPGEEARYWLGMLLSDGWVTDTDGGNPRIGISLVAPDGEYLGEFGKLLGSDRPPRRKRRKTGRDVYTWSTRSKALAAELALWGVVPRKSHLAAPDPRLVDDPHFWRGMIDGDGHVKDIDNMFKVSLTGTEATCVAFAHWSHRLCGGDVTTVHRSNRESYCVHLHGERARAVLKAMYEAPGPALARKRLLALEMLEKWKDRVFRLIVSAETITRDSPMPLSTPTPEEGDAAFAALKLVLPDDVFHAGGPSMFRYCELKAEAAVVGNVRLNVASQWASNQARFHCGHLGWRNPHTVWEEDRDAILAQTLGGSRPTRSLLKRKAYCAANYNIASATALLRHVGAKRVLDPCAGWGDRLVAAGAAGAVYRGYDPQVAMQPAYKALASRYGLDATVSCGSFLSGRQPEGFDTVICCPPYFDTEDYGQDPGQSTEHQTYSAWRDGFYLPLLQRAWMALQAGGALILTVANVDRQGDLLPLVEDAVGALGTPAHIYALRFRGHRGVRHNALLSEPTLLWRKTS